MKKEIKLSGFICIDEFGLCLSGYGQISQAIEEAIYNVAKEDMKESIYQYKDEDSASVSLYLPRVSFSLFFSDKECSLEEAQSNVALMSIGCLDLYEEWWGYSEYTIMGYDIINFKLVSTDGGVHDLEQIFRSYNKKYVHIVMEVLSNEI